MSSPCRTDFNCSHFYENDVEPNSDIAGIGVVIGFAGTAYLAFVLLLIHYIVAYDPELPPPPQKPTRARRHIDSDQPSSGPPRANSQLNTYDWTPNPIDVKFLAWVRRNSVRILAFSRIPNPIMGTARSEKLQDCFNKSIGTMCDIQALTGISILIGGFICLEEPLSAHHWQLIVNLAWFSSNTYLSGLTTLRRHLQAHRSARYTRLFFMLVLVILLVTAMMPSVFFNWHEATDLWKATDRYTAAWPEMPAVCFFSYDFGRFLHGPSSFWGSSAFLETVISLILLLGGFISRVFKLSLRLPCSLRTRVGLPLARLSDVLATKVDSVPLLMVRYSHDIRRIHASWSVLITRTVTTAIIVTRTQFTLQNSMLGELFWLLVVLLWGTSKLKESLRKERRYEEWYSLESEIQNSPWQFGQVLPVLLLAAPMGTLLSTFVSDTTSWKIQDIENHPTICENCRRRTSEPSDILNTQALNRGTEVVEVAPLSLSQQQESIPEPANPEDGTTQAIIQSSPRYGNISSESQWMLPYLATSFLVLCLHLACLFWFTTYLVPRDYGTRDFVFWTPADYLLKVKGFFYLVLLSYPSAAHTIVLYGLAADDWFQPTSAAKIVVRQVLLWLFAIFVHSLYLLVIYAPLDWGPVTRVWMICSIAGGFYVLYAITCIGRQLMGMGNGRSARLEENETTEHVLIS